MNSFWISEFKKTDEEWIKNLDDELCDEAMGFSIHLEKVTIIPYGSYTRHFGESYEDVTIRSAIVTLKTSDALLRALQTTKDNYDYSIPLEESEHQIDVLGFQFKGWLKKKKFDYEELEKEDPFANDMSKYCVCLGDTVDKTFDIKYSDDFKKAFYKGMEITSFLNWSNVSKHNKYSRFESEGSILEVNIDFLLTFLKTKNVAMIVECQIGRHFKEPDYKHSKSISNKIVKLYLIYPDGEVKTIRGRNYQIG